MDSLAQLVPAGQLVRLLVSPVQLVCLGLLVLLGLLAQQAALLARQVEQDQQDLLARLGQLVQLVLLALLVQLVLLVSLALLGLLALQDHLAQADRLVVLGQLAQQGPREVRAHKVLLATPAQPVDSDQLDPLVQLAVQGQLVNKALLVIPAELAPQDQPEYKARLGMTGLLVLPATPALPVPELLVRQVLLDSQGQLAQDRPVLLATQGLLASPDPLAQLGRLETRALLVSRVKLAQLVTPGPLAQLETLVLQGRLEMGQQGKLALRDKQAQQVKRDRPAKTGTLALLAPLALPVKQGQLAKQDLLGRLELPDLLAQQA